ncbi:MAG: bifunctional demethylmenaquinone methyltransferase/2-methoxy-6-polyprenyl-1,4-benzoquinol methylase UbiE [Deltaproteobacteria bacterium]|nr:bifunctional demethylmenaquinone methyltransferase/2-methoxy-6-polyprenyl-1,4-benzoquinol methylase UbiE [Deltaproteobacteria bacterium]
MPFDDAPQDKSRQVLAHFNRVAARYDLMNSLLSFGLHHWWKRVAVGLLDLRPGGQVLDVCGGTGDLAVIAAQRIGPRGRAVVYDFSRAMLEAGRPKTAVLAGWGKILHVQGDALRLAFPDNCFDAVMVGFGIRNLSSMDAGFREMHRVLKPGGRMMCLEFSCPATPWFRRLYDLYSFAVMPLAGKIIAGSREAYSYLPESIRKFPLPEELSALLRSLGFTQVGYHRLTNGIAVAHVGVKERE